MNSLNLIGAIVRKDTQSLWPLALPAMLLLVCEIVLREEKLPQVPQLLMVLLSVASAIATGFLITAAIHADPPAGTRHEWLTRPVPRSALFAAKAVFVIVVVLLPSMLAETIISLRHGASLGQVVLAATSIQWAAVSTVLALCVVAVTTATLLESVVTVVAVIAAALFLVPVMLWLSGTGEEVYISGAGWIAEQPRALFAVAMCAVVIWLMYARRRTKVARILFAIAVVLIIMSPVFMPWRAIFAIQKALSRDAAAANSVALARDGACFAAITVNPPSTAGTGSGNDAPAWSADSTAVLSSKLWSEEQRRAAGANAIGFETRVALSGAPPGWRTTVGRVEASYMGPDNRVVHTLRPARYTPSVRRVDAGTQLVSHFWLLPRSVGTQSAADSPLTLDYSLSLLRPATSVEIDVDAKRRDLPGFGYCSAQFDRATSTIKVDCFKRGPQPDQMTANLAGAGADLEVPSGYPNFTPSAFELLGGKRHVMTLRNVPQDRASRVSLTIYEAQAHFNREVIAAGFFGATPDACPAPDEEQT